MRLGERVGDPDPVAQRLIERDGALREASRKGFPLEVLHDEEIHSAVTAHVEDVADMGMTECRECSRFAFEPLTPDRIFGVGGRQDLDGDGPLETRVPCRVHLAHPSGAERREDFVRAQALADGHTRQLGRERACRELHGRQFEERVAAGPCCEERVDFPTQVRVVCAGVVEKRRPL